MFHSYGRAYCNTCNHVSSQKILYTYTSTSQSCFFVLLHVFQSIGSQPYQGSFAHTSTNTFFKEDHNHSKKVLKGFLCTAVSLKMTLDSFQTPYTRGLYSYSWGKRTCCTRHVLEDADLKTNFKGHAETCLLILFSSLGCVVFPPWFQVTFWEGAQTMCENQPKP